MAAAVAPSAGAGRQGIEVLVEAVLELGRQFQADDLDEHAEGHAQLAAIGRQGLAQVLLGAVRIAGLELTGGHLAVNGTSVPLSQGQRHAEFCPGLLELSRLGMGPGLEHVGGTQLPPQLLIERVGLQSPFQEGNTLRIVLFLDPQVGQGLQRRHVRREAARAIPVRPARLSEAYSAPGRSERVPCESRADRDPAPDCGESTPRPRA